jgi:adenine/guanine phosphoribosyltransferase-like PRPP-binding protein
MSDARSPLLCWCRCREFARQAALRLDDLKLPPGQWSSEVCVVTVGAAGAILAAETARALGLPATIVAQSTGRTKFQPREADVWIERGDDHDLVLDRRCSLVAGMKVLVLEPVIADGQRIARLLRLIRQTGADVVAIAAIAVEVDGGWRSRIAPADASRLITLGSFPRYHIAADGRAAPVVRLRFLSSFSLLVLSVGLMSSSPAPSQPAHWPEHASLWLHSCVCGGGLQDMTPEPACAPDAPVDSSGSTPKALGVAAGGPPTVLPGTVLPDWAPLDMSMEPGQIAELVASSGDHQAVAVDSPGARKSFGV